jgi:hypothetical protein
MVKPHRPSRRSYRREGLFLRRRSWDKDSEPGPQDVQHIERSEARLIDLYPLTHLIFAGNTCLTYAPFGSAARPSPSVSSRYFSYEINPHSGTPLSGGGAKLFSPRQWKEEYKPDGGHAEVNDVWAHRECCLTSALTASITR